MSDTKPRARPVTYIDAVYRARTIRVGDAELRVENGRIVVTDPDHVEALDADPALRREESRC